MPDSSIEFDQSSFSDKVYSAILELLINHNFKPGDKISEETIASLLNVSRTPVREALRRLASDGLVDYFPRRGVYAKDITDRDIIEIYELRQCLEVQAARMAIGNIPTEQIERIDAMIDECHRSEGAGFIEAELRLDREIHNTINAYCRNGRLRLMLQKIDYMAKFMRIIHSNSVEVVRDNFREHENIWNALKSNDDRTMVRLIGEHLNNRRNCLLEDFKLLQDGRRETDATV